MSNEPGLIFVELLLLALRSILGGVGSALVVTGIVNHDGLFAIAGAIMLSVGVALTAWEMRR